MGWGGDVNVPGTRMMLRSGDGKAMFMVKPSGKENWSLLGEDVTSPAKCAAAVVSQPTTYETGRFLKCQICKLCRKTQAKLKITMELALKIDMNQAKKTCKTHDCQDSDYQKNAILHGRKTRRVVHPFI